MASRRQMRWAWVSLVVSFAPSAFAQTATERTGPQEQRPTTAPPRDDGLEVPATLAPLVVAPPNEAAPIAPLPVPRPPARFGDRGQWVLMGSSNSFFTSSQTFSASEARFFQVGGAIGLDHFVIKGVSIGLDAEAGYNNLRGYGATTLAETKTTEFAGGARFGVNLRLSQSVSWYPRLTLMLASSHSSTKPISSSNGTPLGSPSSESSVGPAVNLFAPLLVHPASHFVVGFGPRLQHDFGVTRGGPYDGSQYTRVSGEFVVGGWWGGESPEAPRAAADAASPAKASDLKFGKAGQLVLTTATGATLAYRSYSRAKGSQTSVTIAPGFDYFVLDKISIGIDAVYAYTDSSGFESSGTSTQSSSKTFGVAPRLGANLELSALASLWLRAEAGFGTVNSSISSVNGTNQHSRSRSWVELSAPLLLHPDSHFFVGAGPFVHHELSDKDQYDQQNKATTLGATLVLGGWFVMPESI